MLIFGGKLPIKVPLAWDMRVTYIKLKAKPVWKLKTILFNIECYVEFFSGITPNRCNTTKEFSIAFYVK